MPHKPKLRVLLLSVGHALLLSLFTLIWMNQSWEFSDEVIVARINQIARYEIFGLSNPEEASFRSELLCINCSYDKTLIPYEDDWGMGYEPITDRKKLAEFFAILAETPTPPKVVVVDILFEGESENDSLLRFQMSRCKNLIISTVENNQNEIVQPWPELPFALAQYATTTGNFLKYNLMHDAMPYLPTAMYEISHHEKFAKKWGLVTSSSGWWHNSYIVDLPIRKIHFDDNSLLIWNLGEAMETFSRQDIFELVADKVIVIGDYHRYDNHGTLLGPQPGPLIVANAYLGMLQGAPRMKLLDGFLIFILYFFTTLYAIYWSDKRGDLTKISVYRFRIGKFVVKYLTYILIFSLYSVFLYLLTSRHFQLLLFALYFNGFEYVMSRYSKKRLSEPQEN